MALVSGGSSRLNPNAPLYIPAVVRQVEDFTPEWYDLISTSTWYRDYWLSQHQEASTLPDPKVDNLDIVDMLPDDIDFGIQEDMSTYMGSNFREFAPSHGHQANSNIFTNENGALKNVGVSEAVFPPGSKFAAQRVDNVQGKRPLWMRV